MKSLSIIIGLIALAIFYRNFPRKPKQPKKTKFKLFI